MKKPEDVNASCASPCSHPIQPIVTDKHGVKRFKMNRIVRYMLDMGDIGMNELAMMEFSQEDREQFAQLIGYSLSGFSELSYVSDVTYETAATMADNGTSEAEARIAVLEEKLEAVRAAMKTVVPNLFRICPDDLVV
jgi:hypothetical protein